MTVGIVGYGAYVPKYRIKTEDIAKVWGEDAERITQGLGILEKSVPDMDEDAATLAVEAAKIAVKRGDIDPQDIDAVFVGSESHPYAVKPTATIVAEALGATPHMTAADLEFACKAGTVAIQIGMALVNSNMAKYALAVGTDTSQGRPGDALEYSAGAGAGAFIIGNKNIVAEINGTYSFTTDTPDFWRRPGKDYPSHGGRFTGEPAYFKHVSSGAKGMMERMNTTVEDYDFFVFHQPNAKFPIKLAKDMGIPKEKVLPGLMTPLIGNTYSGATMVGLANVLDKASPGSRILVASFGSGAGSDAFDIKVTDKIEDIREKGAKVQTFVDNKKYISYGEYVKHRRKLKM
ncbi:hydroxymethylglutaryl-CoA synthase [Candidatus Micrarchaeota archaeon]|nr:hydroxymethylglutaryl-CoA synthase [Candidatus Micrarchaeota archaeon]